MIALAVPAGAVVTSVSEGLSLSREAAQLAPDCVITGDVSFVVEWQKDSFLVTAPNDPDGQAIYVSGDWNDSTLPADCVERGIVEGDRVVVKGRVINLQLEPGVYLSSISRIGHVDLPPPPEKRLADIRHGLWDNRRVRISGVVKSTRTTNVESGVLTCLLLGTMDGDVTVRLRGPLPPTMPIWNADVTVEGVVMPLINSRSEFIFPEIEVTSPDRITVHRYPPRDPFQMPELDSMGALSWVADGEVGVRHARTLRGEVTYVSRGSFFVVQFGNRGIYVRPSESTTPEIGDVVEVAGFPTLFDDVGSIDQALFRKVGSSVNPMQPYMPTATELRLLITGGYHRVDDFHWRLVRLPGRVTDFEPDVGDGTRFSVLVNGRMIRVTCVGTISDQMMDIMRDGPLVDLTGVLKLDLGYNPENLRSLDFATISLLMRGESDILFHPDPEWDRRRFGRRLELGLRWSLLPLFMLLLGFFVKGWRSRDRDRAIARDRKRMAGELHDTLAQHLAGARMLLYSVMQGDASISPESREALGMAGDVLETARREVRDAILNLQSDDLASCRLESLLQKISHRPDLHGRTRIRVRLSGLPRKCSVDFKTDVVGIVQEAVTNAVKHGGARNVIIVSDPRFGGGFRLSVLNDGAPMPEKTVGPESGHFGISGMRERAKRAGLMLTIGKMRDYVAITLEGDAQ